MIFIFKQTSYTYNLKVYFQFMRSRSNDLLMYFSLKLLVANSIGPITDCVSSLSILLASFARKKGYARHDFL